MYRMGQSNDRVVAVIPARWASSRFPGKPLAELAGEPDGARTVSAELVNAQGYTSAPQTVSVTLDREAPTEPTIEGLEYLAPSDVLPISDALGISNNAVAVRLHRALKRLKEAVEDLRAPR